MDWLQPALAIAAFLSTAAGIVSAVVAVWGIVEARQESARRHVTPTTRDEASSHTTKVKTRQIFWLSVILLFVSITSIFGWPAFFSIFRVLPSRIGTFNDWQLILIASSALAAAIGGATTFVLTRARRENRRVAWSLVATTLILVSFVGIGAGAAQRALESARNDPLTCANSTQPPEGSAISCVSAGGDYWVAREPYFETEKKETDPASPLDTSDRIGINTGARIYYGFDSPLNSCLFGLLAVYQTAGKVIWPHTAALADALVTIEPVQSEGRIDHYAPGRNTWETYAWRDSEPANGYFSAVNEFILAGPDGEGLGATHARLTVRALYCPDDVQEYFNAASSDLLKRAQLADSAYLDSGFIRDADPSRDLAAANLHIPVIAGAQAVYPQDWRTGAASSMPWEIGTKLTFSTLSGRASAVVWVAAADGTAPSYWTSTRSATDGARDDTRTFEVDGRLWTVTIHTTSPEGLGVEGERLISRFRDGVTLAAAR